MPSEYLLAAPVLGIVWPSMAVALWWGTACAFMGARDEVPRDGGEGGGESGGKPARKAR